MIWDGNLWFVKKRYQFFTILFHMSHFLPLLYGWYNSINVCVPVLKLLNSNFLWEFCNIAHFAMVKQNYCNTPILRYFPYNTETKKALNWVSYCQASFRGTCRTLCNGTLLWISLEESYWFSVWSHLVGSNPRMQHPIKRILNISSKQVTKQKRHFKWEVKLRAKRLQYYARSWYEITW